MSTEVVTPEIPATITAEFSQAELLAAQESIKGALEMVGPDGTAVNALEKLVGEPGPRELTPGELHRVIGAIYVASMGGMLATSTQQELHNRLRDQLIELDDQYGKTNVSDLIQAEFDANNAAGTVAEAA